MLIYSKYKYLHVKIASTIIERASSQSGHHDMQVIWLMRYVFVLCSSESLVILS